MFPDPAGRGVANNKVETPERDPERLGVTVTLQRTVRRNSLHQSCPEILTARRVHLEWRPSHDFDW
jgi:hypothetical protein